MKDTTTPQTKVCKRCGRELPADAFGRHARTKDGLQPICRECRSKSQKGKPKKDEPEIVVITDDELATKTAKGLIPLTVGQFSDDAIIESLRQRGYTGTLTKQIQITL